MYGYQHFKGIVSGKKEYVESTAERLMTWDASVKLLKDNYRFGMGNGDVRDALSEKYFELGYEKPAMLRLNSHNQYLETFLTIGIPGFITLLIMLFAPVLFSKGPYDFLIKTFIFIIAVNFLFESMLNTQAGVIFFFFFYSLLISYNRNKPQHKPVITEEDYL
jgi:O-antigen ligase